MPLSPPPNTSSSSPPQLQSRNSKNSLQSLQSLHDSAHQQHHTPRNTCRGVEFFISEDGTTSHQDNTSDGRKSVHGVGSPNLMNPSSSEVGVVPTPIRRIRLKQLARAMKNEFENQDQKKSLVLYQENLEDSTQQEQDASLQLSSLSTPCKKRNRCPGLRIRGSRIFDSENGKTCHQCRQKTMDLVASCKVQRETKSCRNMYCFKCLFNRYEEIAEEANQISDWSCPRCRGICNCSLCMKKRGLQPIGIRSRVAKAAGLQLGFEMLAIEGPRNSSGSVKRKRTSLTKENASAADGRSDVGTSTSKKAHLRREVNLRVSVGDAQKTEVQKTERVDGIRKNTAKIRLKQLARLKKIKPEKSNSDYNLIGGRKDDEVPQPMDITSIVEMNNQVKARSGNKITLGTIKTVSNRIDVLSVLLPWSRIEYR